jgi:predicted amidohydrolase
VGGEKKIFTSGDDGPAVVELPFGSVGLMICYDLRLGGRAARDKNMTAF